MKKTPHTEKYRTNKKHAASHLLIKYRETKGLTLSQMAKKFHVSTATYFRWEAGKVTPHPRKKLCVQELTFGLISTDDWKNF